MHLTTIAITVHEAERQVAAAVAGSPCCSSCCCCSCCLHAAGGIVGAAGASVGVVARSPDRDQAALGTSYYWASFAALALVALAVACLSVGVGWGCILLLLGLPVVQLAASPVALLVVALGPVRDKGAAAKAIAWITLWAFLGALAGLLVMLVLGGALLALA